VSRPSRTLIRRIEGLEAKAKSASPRRNPLVDLATTAMAVAWTPEEVERMLAASERSQLKELPADLRSRWVVHLDRLSVERFGRSFRELLVRGALETCVGEINHSAPLNGKETNCKETINNGYQEEQIG
jgi:hypothetical protein